jgi:selenocysteine lyase/cysteine desulfurase
MKSQQDLGGKSPIEEARALFPITRERVYLFAGALCPAADPVRDAMQAWLETWAHDPCFHRTDYFTDWRRLRESFALLVHANESEIAITDNTSRGANLAIAMIDLREGSNVVVDATTYPSSFYPLLLPERSGVEVRAIPTEQDGHPRLDVIADLIDERTVAVSVSHICRTTGFRHDLRPLADLIHARNGYLLVDAAQSAGAVEIDVRAEGVDMLFCGAMKWLLGPPGVGFLYIRRELADTLSPPHVGPVGLDLSSGYPNDPRFAFKDGARRHELGIGDLPGIAGARAGIEILLRFGAGAIEIHVLELTRRLIEGLRDRGVAVMTPLEPTRRGGVVAFRHDRPTELMHFLRDRKIDVWGYSAESRMRADPHLYNNTSEIDQLLAGIDEFEAGRR